MTISIDQNTAFTICIIAVCGTLAFIGWAYFKFDAEKESWYIPYIPDDDNDDDGKAS